MTQSQISVYSNSGGAPDRQGSRTNISIESDDGERSYTEIETEIHQAVLDLMISTQRQVQQYHQEETSSSNLHKKRFLEQLFLSRKKLSRSSSLFFTAKHQNGHRVHHESPGSEPKKYRKKWSQKLATRKTPHYLSANGNVGHNSCSSSKRCKGHRHGPPSFNWKFSVQRDEDNLEHSA